MIYFINTVEDLLKTDLEQQWGKPTVNQFVKDKYSKGQYFYEMFPPNKCFLPVQPFPVKAEELHTSSALSRILKESENNKVRKKGSYRFY